MKQLLVLFAQLGLNSRYGVSNDLGQVVVVEGEAHSIGFERGNVEQIVDQASEPVGAVADGGDRLTLRHVQRAELVVEK